MPDIQRLTHDGRQVAAPAGTWLCGDEKKPYPGEWVHRVFAPDNPGPMVQLMTTCGRRAHRFVLADEAQEVTCPRCLERMREADDDHASDLRKQQDR